MKLLISSCLLGLKTKYNGESNEDIHLIEYLKENNIEFYPLCAEQLGGLSTPREACEIESGYTSNDILNGKGRVLSKNGVDCTKHFILGAQKVLQFCKQFGITHAIVQPRSPSCGLSYIYDGSFSGKLIKGNGVMVQLLINNGIEVVSDLRELRKKVELFK